MSGTRVTGVPVLISTPCLPLQAVRLQEGNVADRRNPRQAKQVCHTPTLAEAAGMIRITQAHFDSQKADSLFGCNERQADWRVAEKDRPIAVSDERRATNIESM